MSSFEICNFEEFVAEVTPQVGSLEEAASANEIFIQQTEGYLQRMKAAMCADILNLEQQILNAGGGGGEPWRVSQRHSTATNGLTTGATHFPIDFELAGINDAPSELLWDGVNFAWENISTATLYCNVLATLSCQAVGSGRPSFTLQLDTGGGFADITGTNFWSEVGRMNACKAWRINLAPGDKIAVAGRGIVASVNMILSSTFQILSKTEDPAT